MIDIINFFKDNLEYIIIGSIFLLTILVIFNILNINFNDLSNKNLNNNIGKIVTIETMLNREPFDATFCKKHETKPHKLNELCNNFNKEGCNSTRCCVWVKHDGGEECVAGNIRGPTFYGTEESPLKLHHHHYKGECIPGLNVCPSNDGK